MAKSDHNRGTSIPFIYFVYAGVIILTYFLGWIVIAVFIGLLILMNVFAYFDDKKNALQETSFINTQSEDLKNPEKSENEEAMDEDYLDAQGNCTQCGNKAFSVTPGQTTAAEIMAFASQADGWKENQEALAGWMPPGIYCPKGCLAIHITPEIEPNNTWQDKKTDGIPKPVRILFADVLRDGGSYTLMYESETDSVKIELKVIRKIKNGNYLRIGYQKPQLIVVEAKTLTAIETKEMDWDEALVLSKLLKPLLISSPKIDGGGKPRATEMLRYLTLRGGL